ncbi:unnamed protein product [Miscanthus lutarioriparius]|uniref:Macro domain-containing protein n=1 Tax=Miscanthus lutarioriparius TaxID=422564 RepID=A0A811MP33_9POAL|nr:unnamed protein product [Miscanthus lutarioriparius]
MQPRSPAAAEAEAAGATMVPGVGGVEPAVTLDQVPRWSDPDQRIFLASTPDEASAEGAGSDTASAFGFISFSDPLTVDDGAGGGGRAGGASRFPVDQEINSRIYLWRGQPWNLEVDAVVNSTNESLDEAHSSPGLHAAAGSGLAEECATLGGCRTGMAKMTNAYDLPARKVIHTVGPKYAVKYHTAAENALSHCYRSCLELLIENGLESIAMGCIYTEAKNYPREPASHVAIRTVRRFLEKQKGKITGVVFCTTSSSDTEIYKRLLPLYFPRDKQEEEIAILKLPADVGDENGETVIDERKIRIRPLPAGVVDRTVSATLVDLPLSDSGSALKSYRGGVDIEGRSVMVVVGAHFLLRCLDLEREFEPLIQKPYTIVYFHSAASLQPQPDLGFMKRLQQILGRKHQRNLHAIYVLHPTLGLRTAVLAMQMFVDGEVWKKVVYVDRLVQLFRYVPLEQLTIPTLSFSMIWR